MKRWNTIEITIILINVLFQTHTQIVKQIDGNTRFENSYEAVARHTLISMQPVIKSIESNGRPVIEIQSFFCFCFKSASEIVIAVLRIFRTVLRAVGT